MAYDFDWTYYADPDACTPEMPNVNEQTFEAGGAWVPPELSAEIMGLLYDNACVEALSRHTTMKSRSKIIRSITDGVQAYWVGAGCVKPKDAQKFGGLEITARKLAVILPFENEFLDDMDTDMVAEAKNDVYEAFKGRLDASFLGYDATTPFAQSLSGSVPAGQIVNLGDAGGRDFVDDISLCISLLEGNGMDCTGMISNTFVKHLLRILRDNNGNPIYTENLGACVPRERYCVWGYPICFTNRVPLDDSPAGYEMIIADFDYVLVGDKKGISMDKSTQATLTYGSGETVNLWEQNMTAFLFEMEKGFLITNEDALTKLVGIA